MTFFDYSLLISFRKLWWLFSTFMVLLHSMALRGWLSTAAAAAAKSLQSCPTLCDPIDSSPPGSAVPGILQARTLQWVAISFSNAWKWKVKGKSLSHVQLLATPWTTAYQAPPSMGFSRQEHWSGVPLPSLGLSILLPWHCFVLFLRLSNSPLYICTRIHSSVSDKRAFMLFPCFVSCAKCCYEHWSACIFSNYGFITDSLCCTPETNTTLFINDTPMKTRKFKWRIN